MMKTLSELSSQSLDALDDQFYRTDQQMYNITPFEGSWTAGQLVQHLILSNSGFVALLNGQVTDTDRPADLQVENIKIPMLDFSIKMDSPAFILPKLKDYDREAHLALLKEIRENFITAINQLDLTKTCTGFEVPVLGYLTRLEAAYFVVYHTMRHTRQLENIINLLT